MWPLVADGVSLFWDIETSWCVTTIRDDACLAIRMGYIIRIFNQTPLLVIGAATDFTADGLALGMPIIVINYNYFNAIQIYIDLDSS